jgi:hypothetical protein
MAIAVPSPQECKRRWAEACSQAVREGLESPRTQAQYDWALGFAVGYLRKVTRKANSQAIITLSLALLQEAGLEGAERVVLLPLPEGGLLLRRATEQDVSEAHARNAAGPRPCLPARPAPEDLPVIEKLCGQCGLTFRTQQQRRVYCDSCRRESLRASWRGTWRRRGKLTPSYRRKLRSARLAGASHARPGESLSLTFADETDSEARTATPFDAFLRSHTAPFDSASVAVPLESAR